ncbi:MAG: hypothetical protein Q8906_06010 [Bacillota bacterium]|nr:hypothetical protein [Bacillota bacterium]
MMYLAGAVSLLKLCLWCTGGGLAVTLLNDKDIHRLVKKVGVKMVKRVKKFDIEYLEHTTVLGLTQHGKTYGLIKTMDTMKGAILFFNTNDTPLKGVKSKWYDAHGGHDLNQIIYALRQGYKINFVPSDDNIKAEKQLKAITEAVYNEGRGKLKFRFAIDEVHLFKKEGKTALIRLASTALGRGIVCIFISQRPAMIDNTLLTQSTKHILFAIGLNDASYLKSNGFPSDEIMQKTGQEKYIFVEFDQKEVKGPYKII